jgi:GNAT superfamily N-acetyltransferase
VFSLVCVPEIDSNVHKRYRQSVASDLFLGAFLPSGQLVGFVSGTAMSTPNLSHQAMEKHDPQGTHVGVHSVVVSSDFRHRGVGSDLLRNYVDLLKKTKVYKSVVLIVHEELIPFYERAGFELRGKSDVVHGPKEWLEMAVDLDVRSPGRKWSQVEKQHVVGSDGKNLGRIYCPFGGCTSLILRPGQATWVERSRQPVCRTYSSQYIYL